MKVFISQPMNGRSRDDILMERHAITNIVKRMYGEDTEIIGSYEEYDKRPLKLLGRAIEKLADVDLMVIAPEAGNSRGCRIEKACCDKYMIPYIFLSIDALETEFMNMEKSMIDTLQQFNLPVHPIRKTIIVINGKGGVGKDTLCRIAGEYFRTKTISAIDPIKCMAMDYMNWDNDKSDKGRKLLSDLKAISVQYNDTPNTYLLLKSRDFIKPDDQSQILFVHIREPEEIDKFVHSISAISACCQVKTVLIRSNKLGKDHYGNASDDNVENYAYDHYFDNNGTLEETEASFIKFLLLEVGV